MNKASQSIFAAATLATLLSACHPSDAPALAGRDPSVPDAAAAFAAQDAADKTKAMQSTAALQANAVPQKAMTKAEESKAMPLPGQANDHSATPAKSKGG